METLQPQVGQRWIELGMGEPDWRIVKVKDNKVGLSGPGPCRSYQEIELEQFVKEWEPRKL